MKRQPIQKRKLSDDVRARLLEEIQEGKLLPGSPLPSERELMAAYGVGRPAIREAMQSLQGLGLIIVRHGERPCVAEPRLDLLAEQMALAMRHILSHDASILAQLKQARTLLETELARIAAREGDPGQVAELRKILDAQAQASGSFQDFMRLDGAFHAKIAQMCGNALLEAVVAAIFNWLERFHIESVRREGLENLTLEEHSEILSWIEAGDPDRAGDAMRHHLTRANHRYQQNAGTLEQSA